MRHVREVTWALTGRLETLSGRLEQGPRSVMVVARTTGNYCSFKRKLNHVVLAAIKQNRDHKVERDVARMWKKAVPQMNKARSVICVAAYKQLKRFRAGVLHRGGRGGLKGGARRRP